MPVVAESARRISPACAGQPRNDSIIASIGCAWAQMTGWSNVLRKSYLRGLASVLKDTQLSPRSRPPGAPSSTPPGSDRPADTVLLAHVRPAAAQPTRQELARRRASVEPRPLGGPQDDYYPGERARHADEMWDAASRDRPAVSTVIDMS